MKGKFFIMRVTKKIKETNTTLPVTTNATINTSTQTPIEIALQIDENGMTTASKLYSFLELEPSHFFTLGVQEILKTTNLPLKM